MLAAGSAYNRFSKCKPCRPLCVVKMSSSLVNYQAGRVKALEQRRDAEEEWVTTKKVEIVTTKNVERKIQRQVVLQDGRVVEEEIPTVTVDTTEDKQSFETDQDEARRKQ